MFNLSKVIGAAAAGLLAMTLSVAAATIDIDDGAIVPINPGDLYNYDETLIGSGGADFVAFTFIADAADTPLAALAATVNFSIQGTMIGAFLSWTNSMGTTVVALGDIGSGVFSNEGVLSTLFAAPDDLVQTLALGWESRSGTLDLNVQVTAPVPVPAAGLLLVGALGGLGVMARRRRMAA